jgi:hypothetical protein
MPAWAQEAGDGTSLTVVEMSGASSSLIRIATYTAGNTVIDHGTKQYSTIQSSFGGNQGAMLFNQDSGNINSQANVLVLSLARSDNNSYLDSTLIVTDEFVGNTVAIYGGERANKIESSFHGAKGIALVNQTSGNLNVQRNVMNVGLGLAAGDTFVSVNERHLSAHRGDNTLTSDGTTKLSNTIDGSFTGYRGVAAVTQTAGEGNIVTNSVSIGIKVLNVR